MKRPQPKPASRNRRQTVAETKCIASKNSDARSEHGQFELARFSSESDEYGGNKIHTRTAFRMRSHAVNQIVIQAKGKAKRKGAQQSIWFNGKQEHIQWKQQRWGDSSKGNRGTDKSEALIAKWDDWSLESKRVFDIKFESNVFLREKIYIRETPRTTFLLQVQFLKSDGSSSNRRICAALVMSVWAINDGTISEQPRIPPQKVNSPILSVEPPSDSVLNDKTDLINWHNSWFWTIYSVSFTTQ
jgi:hypothetical protein